MKIINNKKRLYKLMMKEDKFLNNLNNNILNILLQMNNYGMKNYSY